MNPHLVQTKNWSDFKNIYGTISTNCENVYFTLHRIPVINKYYAYCPKVNPFEIDFKKLIKKLKEEKVIAINFDRPNVYQETKEAFEASKIFENNNCIPANKDTYPPATIMLDISDSPENLIKNFNTKHRYNINVAKRKNLTVTFDIDDEKIEQFYFLQKLTSKRQGYLTKPKSYFETLVKFYAKKDLCVLSNVYYENEPIASWVFVIEGDTAYYLYGGMNENFSGLKPANLLVWESILELKKRGVRTLDFFGACEDLNNEQDPYYGFSIFKIRFGGKHFKYIKSYDLVISPFFYNLFNLAQKFRWFLLNKLR
jgi:lipid II:glycine glycyltransferase (peptidoglycan interpeptide bridge formation enzyme)